MTLVCDAKRTLSILCSIVLRKSLRLLKRYVLHNFEFTRHSHITRHFSLQSLVTFVNKHLSKLNFEVNDLSTDFRDGVYLCLLMGLLGGFFVPLYEFHLTPHDMDQMVHNVAFSFELMQDVGLAKPKARPEGNFYLNNRLRTTSVTILFEHIFRYC